MRLPEWAPCTAGAVETRGELGTSQPEPWHREKTGFTAWRDHNWRCGSWRRDTKSLESPGRGRASPAGAPRGVCRGGDGRNKTGTVAGGCARDRYADGERGDQVAAGQRN